MAEKTRVRTAEKDYLEELPEAKTWQADHGLSRARAEGGTTTGYQGYKGYKMPRDRRDALELDGVADPQRKRDAENHETCIWKRARGV